MLWSFSAASASSCSWRLKWLLLRLLWLTNGLSCRLWLSRKPRAHDADVVVGLEGLTWCLLLLVLLWHCCCTLRRGQAGIPWCICGVLLWSSLLVALDAPMVPWPIAAVCMRCHCWILQSAVKLFDSSLSTIRPVMKMQ